MCTKLQICEKHNSNTIATRCTSVCFSKIKTETIFQLSQELKMLKMNLLEGGEITCEEDNIFVRNNDVKYSMNDDPEQLLVEDLASLEQLDEETIVRELEERLNKKQHHTFVGDVSVIINPNEAFDIYGEEVRWTKYNRDYCPFQRRALQYHKKYKLKFQSDNPPHVYAVAERAYRDALHHNIAQNVLMCGETNSGKTTNFLHVVDHLMYLGENNNVNTARIKTAIKVVRVLTHGSTCCNENATRCVLKLDLVYGRTGKLNGGILNVYLLEKTRVFSNDP